MNMNPVYRPTRCDACGDESLCLYNPWTGDKTAGRCGARIGHGRCNGIVRFIDAPKKAQVLPKPLPAEEADRIALEQELAQLERFQGNPP